MSIHQYSKYTPDMSGNSFTDYLNKINNIQTRNDESLISAVSNTAVDALREDVSSLPTPNVFSVFFKRWCDNVSLGETYITQLEPWCETSKRIISSINIDNSSSGNCGVSASSLTNCINLKDLDKAFVEILDLYIGGNMSKSAKNVNLPLCIDGENCCGKTTLLQNSKLMNAKVNEYYNFDNHNIMPFQSMEYLTLTDFLYFGSNYNVIIDRSPISNLAFQLAFYLRDRHFDQLESNMKFSSYKMCEDYIEMHNLVPLLEYINSKNYNTLILIDSDEQQVAKRMLYRGQKYGQDSDLTKCCDLLYHRSQCIAYSYFAMRLGYPIIDLNYLRELFMLSPQLAVHSKTNLDLLIFELFKKYMAEHVKEKKIANGNVNNSINILKRQAAHYKFDNNFEADYLMAMSLSSR